MFGRRREQQLLRGPHARVGAGRRPEQVGAFVCRRVGARERRDRVAAIAIAADDRDARRMRVVEDRRRVARRRRAAQRTDARRADVAFHDPPAVIASGCARPGIEIDLLARALAHVADKEIAGQPVEREAPRVAQAVRPDFGTLASAGAVARRPGVRIRWRDAVVRRDVDVLVDVEAQELAEPHAERLRIVRRVVAVAAVAGAGVEITVAAERELAAVVVARTRMRDDEQRLHVRRRRVGDVGVVGAALVALDHEQHRHPCACNRRRSGR